MVGRTGDADPFSYFTSKTLVRARRLSTGAHSASVGTFCTFIRPLAKRARTISWSLNPVNLPTGKGKMLSANWCDASFTSVTAISAFIETLILIGPD